MIRSAMGDARWMGVVAGRIVQWQRHRDELVDDAESGVGMAGAIGAVRPFIHDQRGCQPAAGAGALPFGQ
jgi:hypothetical protein